MSYIVTPEAIANVERKHIDTISNTKTTSAKDIFNRSGYSTSSPTRNSVPRAGNTFKSSSVLPKAPSVLAANIPALAIATVLGGKEIALSMYKDRGYYVDSSGKVHTPNDSKAKPIDIPDIVKPEIFPETSPDYTPKTLISVLDSSSNATMQVVEQLNLSAKVNALSLNEINLSLKNILDSMLVKSTNEIEFKTLEFENAIALNDSFSKINDNIVLLASSSKSSLASLDKLTSSVKTFSDKSSSSSKSLKTSIDKVTYNLQKGIVVQKSVEEASLIGKQLEQANFDTTPIQVDNLGDDIPELSPQHMRAIKDAVTAKKNSDENTFELDDEDIFDMFQMPDISSIFGYHKKSERNAEVSS